MEDLFPKQDPTKKPAIIVKRILSLLEAGSLKPGEKLPNELEIVKQSEISRTSVREALSALEANDINLFFDIDCAFHLAIAEAANNEEILGISKGLLAKADTHMRKSCKEDLGLLGPTVEEHTKIVEAIKARDPQKARYLVEQHLAKYVAEN